MASAVGKVKLRHRSHSSQTIDDVTTLTIKPSTEIPPSRRRCAYSSMKLCWELLRIPIGVGEGTGDGEIRDVVQDRFSGVGIGKFTLDFRYVGIFLRSRMGTR